MLVIPTQYTSLLNIYISIEASNNQFWRKHSVVKKLRLHKSYSVLFVVNTTEKMSSTHIETAIYQTVQEDDGIVDINLYTLDLLKEVCPEMDPINMACTALRLINRARREVVRREKLAKMKAGQVHKLQRIGRNAVEIIPYHQANFSVPPPNYTIQPLHQVELRQVENGQSRQVRDPQRFSHKVVVNTADNVANFSVPPPNHIISHQRQGKNMVQNAPPDFVTRYPRVYSRNFVHVDERQPGNGYSTSAQPEPRNGCNTSDGSLHRQGNITNGFKRKRYNTYSHNIDAKRQKLDCKNQTIYNMFV